MEVSGGGSGGEVVVGQLEWRDVPRFEQSTYCKSIPGTNTLVERCFVLVLSALA